MFLKDIIQAKPLEYELFVKKKKEKKQRKRKRKRKKMVGKLFSASRGAHLLFTSDWARLLSVILVWEGLQSSV